MTVEQAEALVRALRNAIADAKQHGKTEIDLQASLSAELGAALDEFEAAVKAARG